MQNPNIAIPILAIAFGLSAFLVWVYALVSAIKNERLDSSKRIAWVLVVILVTGLGAILYLIFAPNRPRRPSMAEREIAEWQHRQQMLADRSRSVPHR
jgi:uncharacterized membrane protein HdeD (DUF308 family)